MVYFSKSPKYAFSARFGAFLFDKTLVKDYYGATPLCELPHKKITQNTEKYSAG
jgi:hypothetical protein